MKNKIKYIVTLVACLTTFTSPAVNEPGPLGDVNYVTSNVGTNVDVFVNAAWVDTYKGYWAVYGSVSFYGSKQDVVKAIRLTVNRNMKQHFGYPASILSIENSDFGDKRYAHLIFRINPTTVTPDGRIVVIK